MLNYHTFDVGKFYADGGVMFGSAPKKYWSKKYPVDKDNLCVMSMRCLLIETESRLILVDAGVGDKHFSKLKYYKFHDVKNISDAIAKKGFNPSEITDVVLTHLHFDHCGGCTKIDQNGKIISVFSNATHWVSRKQWENYRSPSEFEAYSFFSDNIEPIFEAGKLQFVEDDMELTENCRIKLYDGHTPGQIALFFETENQKYVFPGDVIPTSLHLNLGWISAYDNHASLAYNEKKRLLDICREEDRIFIFYHDAYKIETK